MVRKIMVDLSTASDGYSGIPQDSRTIYSMLAHQPEFSVSGLMYSLGRPGLPRIDPAAADAHMRAATTINAISLGWYRRPAVSTIAVVYKKWKELREATRGHHAVQQLPEWLKTDTLWRIMFQKTLLPSEREHILSTDFLVTDLSLGQMWDRSFFTPFLGDKRLAVGDVDAVLLPLPRPVKLPEAVKKVVRYHDAVPLTNSDTVGHWLDIYWHYRFTNGCAKDSVFVCNSPVSVSDLDNVAPGAGSRAALIPCAVQDPTPLKYDINIADILTKRMSLASVQTSGGAQDPRRRSVEKICDNKDFRYIISVSSLEPRKNFVNAIAAWERVRGVTGQDIKLIMVASRGWRQDETFAAMRPHVLANNLIHVEQLPANELQALYQHAELCLFPSYAEGFGYSPLEALQMRTPVVVSDLPVFRWSLEDAALFADPYDVSALAEATLRLIKTPENEPTRMRTLENAPRVLRRFSMATVADQWKQFFQEDIHRLDQKRPT